MIKLTVSDDLQSIPEVAAWLAECEQKINDSLTEIKDEFSIFGASEIMVDESSPH